MFVYIKTKDILIDFFALTVKSCNSKQLLHTSTTVFTHLYGNAKDDTFTTGLQKHELFVFQINKKLIARGPGQRIH